MSKPPLATVSACGTGPVSRGGVRGYFTTGTGGIDIVQPDAAVDAFRPRRRLLYFPGVRATRFWSLSAVPVGTPPTWAITFSTAFSGANVFYDCGGQQ